MVLSSLVPPITSPLFVVMTPGAPAEPSAGGSATSFSAGLFLSDGMSPNGTRQAMSPVFRLIATTSPYGGRTSGRRPPPRPPPSAATVNDVFPCAPANSASVSPGRALACAPGTSRMIAGE